MSFHVTDEQKRKDKENAKNDPVNKTAIPVTQKDDYCAELSDAVMDFTNIRDEQFIVAVSTGDRNKPKLLASTIRGPYTFPEMVSQVGRMWEEHTHHAKVYVLKKDPKEATTFLDAGTIDYIEAYWQEIEFNAALEDILSEDIEDDGEEKEVIPAGVIGSKDE